MFIHFWHFRIPFAWFMDHRNAWYSLTLRCLAHGGIFRWLLYVFVFATTSWNNMADPFRDISWKLKCSILSLLWFPFLLFIVRNCDIFLYYFRWDVLIFLYPLIQVFYILAPKVCSFCNAFYVLFCWNENEVLVHLPILFICFLYRKQRNWELQPKNYESLRLLMKLSL